MKQNLTRTSSLLEERSKALDDRQHEIENLNCLLSRLQTDYEKSKNELSRAHDAIVQHEIASQTLKQHLTEKTDEVNLPHSPLSFTSLAHCLVELVIGSHQSSSSSSA